MAFADPLTEGIVDFIREIGLTVKPASLAMATVLPGVAVARGGLLVDAARLAWPGDLLHEAGHLAVCDPPARPTLDTVGDEPGEEMAAIAWSYAAAKHLDVDPAVVFHEAGYRGGSQALIEAFATGGDVGVPMLEWFGMTLGRRTAAVRGKAAFPHMLRWLR